MDYDEFVAVSRGAGMAEWWIRKHAYLCWSYVQRVSGGWDKAKITSRVLGAHRRTHEVDPLTAVWYLRNDTGRTLVCEHMECNLDFTDQYL